MPQVFKRQWRAGGKLKESQAYYCRFQIRGRDYVRCTGETTLRAAKSRMAELMDEVRNGAQVDAALSRFRAALRDLPEEDAKETRTRLVAELLGAAVHKLAVADAWGAWLEHPGKRTPSQTTLNTYVGQWNRFERWAEAQGIRWLHEVDAFKAEAYAVDLNRGGVSPRTFNAHIKLLRSVFKTLAVRAGLAGNVWEEIALQESVPEGRRDLTPEELRVICGSAHGTLRYLFAIGLYTGMRLGDCVCLGWAAVDFNAGLIIHTPSKTRRKNKQVRIPLHPVLAALLTELKAECGGEYLFPAERAVYLKDPTAISKVIQSFLQECGLETREKIKGRKNAVCRVGFHSLRHSFVSLCAANRVPEVAVMELVGHGSPAMTRIYSHAGNEQKAAAIAALPAYEFTDLDCEEPERLTRRRDRPAAAPASQSGRGGCR